jgi:hypothetical protein
VIEDTYATNTHCHLQHYCRSKLVASQRILIDGTYSQRACIKCLFFCAVWRSQVHAALLSCCVCRLSARL